MRLSISDKVRILARRKGVPMGDLAQAFGTTRQNLWRRLGRESLTLSEYDRIGEALGCSVDVVFTDKETGETL